MMASRPRGATRAPLLPLALTLCVLAVQAAAAGPAPRAPRVARAAGAPPAATLARPAGIVSAPDGAGGAYVVWTDTRDGSSDLYALRVTAAGAPASGWPAAGASVCAEPGEQTEPALVADPSGGGVFVMWRDARDAAYARSYRIQRVDAAGVAQWGAGGIAFAPGARSTPVAAPDGAGGIVFAWVAPGVAGEDVFVGRLQAGGTAPSGWSAGGTAVCEAAGDQSTPSLIGLSGGAVIAWIDPRGGFAQTGVYAQKIASNGAAQWTADGVRVDAASTFLFDATICGDGGAGAVVAWCDFAGAYAQHLDATGAVTWGAAGVTLATPAAAVATGIRAVPDGAGGAFVAWVEAGGVSGLQAQHLDASGAALWPAGGATLATGSASPSLADIVPDAAHGAFFAWDDPRSGEDYDVYAQRVGADGVPRWTANGLPVSTAPYSQMGAAVAPDGAGGAIVTWTDLRDVMPDVYGQRVDSTGVAAWAADGAGLRVDPGVQYTATTVSDGAGGAWSIWQERRPGGFDVRARHIAASGSPDGPAVDVCAASGHQWLGDAVSDGAGGFVVAWEDRRAGDADVYAQRVTAAGAVAWAANGVALCDVARDQTDVRIAPDGTGGCFAAWLDNRVAGENDIYLARVDGTGAQPWAADGIALIGDANLQADPVITPDGAGGVIVGWYDSRSGSTSEIYAQRVTADGAARWAAGGVSIVSDADLSLVFDAAPTGAGGALVLFARSWSDPDTGDPTHDVLALQSVDSTGAAQWGVTGAPVCDVVALVESPSLAPDGAGGAFVAWSDGRSGPFDVYAQHVTAAGTGAWTLDGVAVASGTGWQQMGELVADGAGGVVLAWSDTRGGGAPDVYAQRLDAAGAAQWTAGGVAVSTAAGGQSWPTLATDGAGGALLSWTDDRDAPTRYMYSARVNGTGSVSPADGSVGVSVALVSAAAEPGRVRVVWQVADAAQVTVERRDAASDWRAVATRSVDGDGRVSYQDDAAPAGARLAYRLRIATAGEPVVTPEVWVEVPVAAAFALGGVRPNPATRATTVELSLPVAGPARLELYDAAGRRVRSQRWDALAPGAHVVPLELAGLPAGLYVVRFAQGARAATARLVVTR